MNTDTDQRPTPETDSEAAKQWESGYTVVPADFARKLERQRDQARELLQLSTPYNPHLAANGAYSKRIRRLLDFHRTVDAKILCGRNPRVWIQFLF